MKYMGSKSRFAPRLLPIIARNVRGRPYVEPFVGGFNMIDKMKTMSTRHANDSNMYLIEMMRALLTGWVPKKNYTLEEYEEFKALKGEPHEIGYAGINCSYSGKWFGGYAGLVDTRGGRRNYQLEAWQSVMEQVGNLQGLILSHGDYQEVKLPKNSVIYCDPPYASTTGYMKDGGFDSERFWTWVRSVSRKHEVYISEYQAPEDFECIWQMKAKSSLALNSRGGDFKLSTEKLFIFRG
jgi:DNA adenine methylase